MDQAGKFEFCPFRCRLFGLGLRKTWPLSWRQEVLSFCNFLQHWMVIKEIQDKTDRQRGKWSSPLSIRFFICLPGVFSHANKNNKNSIHNQVSLSQLYISPSLSIIGPLSLPLTYFISFSLLSSILSHLFPHNQPSLSLSQPYLLHQTPSLSPFLRSTYISPSLSIIGLLSLTFNQ